MTHCNECGDLIPTRCYCHTCYAQLEAENARLRQDRQQIEDEIWERINRLFTDQDAVFWKEIEIWCHHTGPLVKNAIIGDRQSLAGNDENR